MALRISTDLKNYIVNQAIVKQMAGTWGTAGTASMTIYTGTQPTNGDTAPSGTSGTALCVISSMGWGASIGSTGGTASFGTTAGYNGTATVAGTAGWARMVTVGTGFSGSAATFRIDGVCGTASTCEFVIDNVTILESSVVTVLTCPISVG